MLAKGVGPLTTENLGEGGVIGSKKRGKGSQRVAIVALASLVILTLQPDTKPIFHGNQF
jgi:hypothetical protein